MNLKYLKIKEGLKLPNYLTDYGYEPGDVVEVIKYLDDQTVLCKLGGYTAEHELTVYIPIVLLEGMHRGVIGRLHNENADKRFPKLYQLEYYWEVGKNLCKGQVVSSHRFIIVGEVTNTIPIEEKEVNQMELVSETQKAHLVIKLGELYVQLVEYSIEENDKHYREHGSLLSQEIKVTTNVEDARHYRISDLRKVKDFAHNIGGTVEAIRTIKIVQRGSIEDLENHLKKNPDKKVEGN